MNQIETINKLRQQIDQLGVQLQHQQAATQHVAITKCTPISEYNSASPPPQYHYSQNISPKHNGLAEVMDVLNRSMTNQYTFLQETLRQ